jgi:predicted MFS family arabinose efflux permease
MLLIVGMAILPSIFVFPYVTFLPVFARDVLHGDESTYGFLAAAVGLGSIVGGGLVAFTSGRFKMGAIMIWTCVIYSLFVMAFALSTHVWLSVVLLTLAGVFFSVYQAFNASLMQLKAEPEYRSRVMSLQTMTWGTTPFAALLMGKMIDAYGAPPVVALFTAVAALLATVIAVFARDIRRI